MEDWAKRNVIWRGDLNYLYLWKELATFLDEAKEEEAKAKEEVASLYRQLQRVSIN